MTLEEAGTFIGRTVLYLPALRLEGRKSTGVITSVDDSFVYVRYGGSKYSAATRPEDLELHKEAAL